MKTLWELMAWVEDKGRFLSLTDYSDFTKAYLECVTSGLQATVIAQNEHNYKFFQYGRDGEYNVTRPINDDIFLSFEDYERFGKEFLELLANIRDIADKDCLRNQINQYVYTTQQSIGAALDALPSSRTNNSRKLNGDLFEFMVRLLLKEIGLEVCSKTIRLPVPGSSEVMSFQHDLVLETQGEVKAIGSVKTSSKDRLDKVFMDKLMYDRLTRKKIPHFSVFLHDVQRAGKEPQFKVGQTFLSGHFKAYSIALCPLDGVYYCDVRPIMKSDPLISRYVKSLDHLLVSDIWRFSETE